MSQDKPISYIAAMDIEKGQFVSFDVSCCSMITVSPGYPNGPVGIAIRDIKQGESVQFDPDKKELG